MLQQLQEQLGYDDEVLVVGDGPQPSVEAVMPADIRFTYIEGPLTKSWGNAQRDLGVKRAKNAFLWFVDDDDALRPSAVATIKIALAGFPDRPHVFCMERLYGAVLGMRGQMVLGDIGSPQVLLPRHPGLPAWDVDDGIGGQGSDFNFFRRSLPLFPPPVWHKDIIYTVNGARTDA